MTKLRERSTSPADYRASYHRVFTKLALMKDAKSLNRPVTATTSSAVEPGELRRLTDGRFGSWESWTSPDPAWVTVVGEHLDVVVDLGAVTDVRAIEIGFLNAQAQPDYHTLVLPDHIVFATAVDGRNFTNETRIANPHNLDYRANPDLVNVPLETFRHAPATPQRARYVRVFAHSMLRMPAWHIMAGKPAALRTDQIVVT